jgi:drug/metabolite transporter (DMT)-like permease
VRTRRSPIATGTGLAVVAALCFGAVTPFVERAGRDLGAFSTAALLYAGACGFALLLGKLGTSSGTPVRRAQLRRLLAVAVCGAGIAPTLFAWGLQRAGALASSLLLNLEVVFTLLFARLVYRERLRLRLVLALSLMLSGGVALALGSASQTGWSALGALAVAGATAGWALDNTLTRALAEYDPVSVVAGKGALGALFTTGVALAVGEPRPGRTAVLALLACGATGYGLSLRFYLEAQRQVGAARTASIFALAPFVGAALAWVLDGAWPAPSSLLAALLFALGVLSHATERHRHWHTHPATEHDHPHRHDDGHHDHTHDPPVAAEHSHPHRHELVEHEHEHAPDAHHEP